MPFLIVESIWCSTHDYYLPCQTRISLRVCMSSFSCYLTYYIVCKISTISYLTCLLRTRVHYLLMPQRCYVLSYQLQRGNIYMSNLHMPSLSVFIDQWLVLVDARDWKIQMQKKAHWTRRPGLDTCKVSIENWALTWVTLKGLYPCPLRCMFARCDQKCN